MEQKKWYTLTLDEAMKVLSSSAKGLSPEEATLRLSVNGSNDLIGKKAISPFIILILIASGVISAIAGGNRSNTASRGHDPYRRQHSMPPHLFSQDNYAALHHRSYPSFGGKHTVDCS